MPLVKTPRHKEFLALLRNRLSGDRYSHCVFAAEYVSSFAESIGVDHDQAVTAALLHDLCREMPDAELLAQSRSYAISMGPAQLEKPMLLHGPVAAEECRRNHGIEDEALYEAIFWHTTGRPGLSMLGRALYVADFAEPRRSSPEAAQAREILRCEGFARALRFVAECKRGHLARETLAEPSSSAFFLWLDKELGRNNA